ncbi:UNVERIFIED_CONTAM: DNA glycosylase/AP lyase ROS1 [Sesamum angustifolium]|uniref:DNA glycosylase/AP lyase ROS1 n=1 Tax=Sesamum angustifolium TaxID=2727405 RepID=A0AAW2QTA2_9LAMI
MGKSSHEDIVLVETPARGESSRDFSQKYRRRRGKCKQEPKDSMNSDGTHLAEVGSILGFPDDENKDEISCLGSEKGDTNSFTDIKTPEGPVFGKRSRENDVGIDKKLMVRRGTGNLVPKVDFCVQPDDILAPRTPDTVTTKHPKCQTEQPEDVLQVRCVSGKSSNLETEQFTYECKEPDKESCRRSLSLEMEMFKRKRQCDLMIDEDCDDVCHNIDDKSASDISVWSSEVQDHAVKITENVHGRKELGCLQDVLVYHRRKSQDVLVYGRKQVRKELLVYQRRKKQAVRKELLVYQRRRRQVGKYVENTNMSEEKKLVCCSPSTQICKGPKKRVLKEMPRPVLMISKHPRSRKQNKKSLERSKSKKGLVRLRPKMQSIPKVDLDEKTVREWKILMYNQDSKELEEDDEWERERWEKERKSFFDQVKSFISNMQFIQGEMHFSHWKGSVIDSIVGAYLTQNVSDTLSSSAFISLAAKYPVGVTRVNSRSKSVQKRKSKDICFKTDTNSKRKRMKKEHNVIDWNALRKNCPEDDRGKYGTLDALDWDAVRMAEVDDIAEAIKKRGMNNNLAARIKNCLNTLERDLGSIDLEWIRDVPPHKAKEYLLSIRGLGLKSVECIRLLTLLHQAFPIDTNAGRVAVRLGWVPLQPLPEGQEFHLLKEYPKVNSIQMYLWPRLSKLDHPMLYELHCQMITIGKVFCTKRNPNCNACPMRAECNHYASFLASTQPSLPDIQEKDDANLSDPMALAESHMMIEVSDWDAKEPVERDIEDFGLDEIPEIIIDDRKLKENIQKFINKRNIPLQEAEMSNTLRVLTSESGSIHVTKLKNLSYLRTQHQVYVLPDSHYVLTGLEEREPRDLCPYLLAIWTPENVNKNEYISQEDTVYGTLLVPSRTAMRGIFPLNGTYFQANEVFADDESSEIPIKVPRESIWHLPCTTLYCGSNISTICRGMKTHEVQNCFRRGYVCFRGFNRKTREAKPLSQRFHLAMGKAEKPRGPKKKVEQAAVKVSRKPVLLIVCISVFLVRNKVEQAAARDVREACAFDSTLHSKVAKVRSRTDRRICEPPQRFRRPRVYFVLYISCLLRTHFVESICFTWYPSFPPSPPSTHSPKPTQS